MKLTNTSFNLAFLVLFSLTSPAFTQDSTKRFTVYPTASSLKWNGAKVGTDQFGKLRLKSGWLTLVSDHITSDEFVITKSAFLNTQP